MFPLSVAKVKHLFSYDNMNYEMKSVFKYLLKIASFFVVFCQDTIALSAYIKQKYNYLNYFAGKKLHFNNKNFLTSKYINILKCYLP